MTAFVFIVVAISGVALFVAPHGRGSVWSFLSLSKHEWADIHIVCGFLFLIAGLVHACLNRRALLSHFSINRQKGMRYEWVIALALLVLLLVLAV
jgi:hypothetical protein